MLTQVSTYKLKKCRNFPNFVLQRLRSLFLGNCLVNKFSDSLRQTRWNFLIFKKLFALLTCGLMDIEANRLTSLCSAGSIVLVF